MEETTSSLDRLQAAIFENAPYILVIDDDLNERETLAQYVSNAGMKPIVAGTSTEALEIAKNSKPAGIIADQFLNSADPEPYGINVVRMIKELHGANGEVPALVVSNAAFSDVSVPSASKYHLPDDLEQKLFNQVRAHVADMLEKLTGPWITELKKYRELLGDFDRIRKVRQFDATVTCAEIPEFPDACRIKCAGEDRERFVPKSCIKAIEALFVTAQVKYTIYDCGEALLSRFNYAGPDYSSLLDRPLGAFEPEIEAELGRTEWHK